QPVEHARVHGEDPLPGLWIEAAVLEDPAGFLDVGLRLLVALEPDQRLGQAALVDAELVVVGVEARSPEVERLLVPRARGAERLALHLRIADVGTGFRLAMVRRTDGLVDLARFVAVVRGLVGLAWLRVAQVREEGVDDASVQGRAELRGKAP